MTLIRVKPSEVPEHLQYNGDFSGISRMEEMHRQAYVNAICITKTNYHAAKELGISDRQLQFFISENGIHQGMLKAMREHFLSTGKKVKLRTSQNEKRKKHILSIT